MGIVDGAGGDGHPELNVESTRRNHELSAGVPLRTESFEDLDGNQQKSPPAPPQQLPEKKCQEQGSMRHSGVVGSGMDRGFQKVGGGGPILRPHRDQTGATAGLSGGGSHGVPGEKDGVQGMKAVAEAIVAAQQQSNGSVGNGVEGKGFKRDIRELEELLSKLNPMAEEFVPPVLANQYRSGVVGGHGGVLTNNIGFHHSLSNGNESVNGDVNGAGRRKKNIFSQGKRMNNRTSMAQREEIIRRTVYVSDIDQQITEEHLAALFINCGQVVDCRICGDPHSVLRFAFIEFTDEEGARAALGLAGTMLGYYPVRVLPSKTAIAPVNPTFLPRSEDEREMCARTIYCTNIDKRVSQADVKLFFESVCGEVYRLRLLGDFNHATRIAFVEFVSAQSAIAALNCSGVVLGSLAIRISPSKTPVRPRAPRQLVH